MFFIFVTFVPVAFVFCFAAPTKALCRRGEAEYFEKKHGAGNPRAPPSFYSTFILLERFRKRIPVE